MTCLVASTQRAVRARKAVRVCESEMCAVSGARDTADLAEHMTLLTEAVEKEPEETSAMRDVLKTSVETEGYKVLSKAAMIKAT